MGQCLAELVGVQFIFPATDDDGGNTIADYVGEDSAFAHEFVDTDGRGDGGCLALLRVYVVQIQRYFWPLVCSRCMPVSLEESRHWKPRESVLLKIKKIHRTQWKEKLEYRVQFSYKEDTRRWMRTRKVR